MTIRRGRMPSFEAMIRVRDALGRDVTLSRPAQRVVSLVPSETESVAALAGVERLVGRTSYCEEPAGEIARVPVIGGTKTIDAGAVLALAPDLVLANQEENSERDVARMIDAGLSVHVSFPCTVAASIAYLRALVALLGLGAEGEARVAALEARIAPPSGSRRLFVPIWRDPWMTFDARTYASDLLAHAGALNVFADRARRYPLAADLGEAPPREPGDRDTRYPRTRPEEIVSRSPDIVLLPDEPYAFGEADVADVEAWGLDAALERVSGKDLFWYGVRTAGAIERVRARLDRA